MATPNKSKIPCKCRDCSSDVPPETGFVYKQPGDRVHNYHSFWIVRCIACARKVAKKK
jgi:hypothetical protein